MKENWDLTPLYTSFDETFLKDLETIKEYGKQIKELISNKNKRSDSSKLEKYLTIANDMGHVIEKASRYVSFILSENTSNQEALKYSDTIDALLVSLVEDEVKMKKWIASLDLETMDSKIIEEHRFILKEIQTLDKYLLDDKTETIIASMQVTGSSAWLKYKDLLVSTLMVTMNDKEYPLTEVLNFAYSKDPNVRKEAYLAEIAAYSKVEAGIAAALNAIKGEVITTSSLKGFSSPLEETLVQSRLSKETLDVLLSVIEESLPNFQEYLQIKAKALGHKHGLPFYDLYASISDSNTTFTYQQGAEFVIKQFHTFSNHLGEYAKKAIDNHWIDVYPKKGKVGGAFCENLHGIKESRILLNYDDNFSNVVTLAHELGHGFHGECLLEETLLNAEYPMPIAETASNFCETIIKKSAIKEVDKKEALAILESELDDCTQVIVDIYSRYLFESTIFEKRKEAALSVEQIKEAMLEAQRKAYGKGLDPKCLHPYMWTWKPHYYYANCSFYNFPYAFGLLLAKGLYAMYQEQGPSFSETYEAFLSRTGKMTLEEVASSVGIDLQDKEFWRRSMQLIMEDINTFKSLIN